MSTTTPTTTVIERAASAAPATTHRGVALVAGFMYLVTIVASVPAQYVNYAPVFSNARYVLGEGADTRVLWGGLLEFITALACIGTAVVLYPVVRRQHEGVALGFVTARVLEAGLIVTGIVSMLSVTTLRQPDATGTEATSLVAAAQALVAIHDWTFLLGPNLLLGLNTLLYSYLLSRTGLVPRPLAALGMIASALILIQGPLQMFGVFQPLSAPVIALSLPVAAFEMILAGWLIVKGFGSSAVPEPARRPALTPVLRPA